MKELKRTMYLLSQLEIAQDLLVNSLNENHHFPMIKFYMQYLDKTHEKFVKYYQANHKMLSLKQKHSINRIYSGKDSWFDVYHKILPRR